jgi:hypothetical protein
MQHSSVQRISSYQTLVEYNASDLTRRVVFHGMMRRLHVICPALSKSVPTSGTAIDPTGRELRNKARACPT